MRLSVPLLAALLLSPGLRADPFTQDDPAKILELSSLNLKVALKDGHDWVMRETGTYEGQEVERLTRRYPDGSRQEQVTTLKSGIQGAPPVFVGTDRWSPKGELTFSMRERDTLSGGVQVSGKRTKRNWKDGRVVKEVEESWSADLHGWLALVSTSNSYYPDGDLRESVKDDRARGTKTRETWGPKGKQGRPKSVATWDGARGAWVEATPEN